MIDNGCLIPEIVPMRRKETKFTDVRMEQIRNLVERGHSTEEIAGIVGCTPGTLKVMCSKLGVSLRRPRFDIFDRPVRKKACSQKPSEVIFGEIEPPAIEPPPPHKEDPKPEFSLCIRYKGFEKTIPLSITPQQFSELVLEAEMRDMHLGEFIAALLMGSIRR